jgi:hypothetical protein
MNYQLSPVEIKKISVAIGVALALGLSGLFARNRAEANRAQQHTMRQMSLEMGRTAEANFSSPPEEEAHRTDPNFRP